jgi:hypothetical protein
VDEARTQSTVTDAHLLEVVPEDARRQRSHLCLKQAELVGPAMTETHPETLVMILRMIPIGWREATRHTLLRNALCRLPLWPFSVTNSAGEPVPMAR